MVFNILQFRYFASVIPRTYKQFPTTTAVGDGGGGGGGGGGNDAPQFRSIIEQLTLQKDIICSGCDVIYT